MMTIRTLTTRAVLLLAAAVSLTTLGGCTSGPHQQPTQTSSVAKVGKDGKEGTMMTSGPHQGS